MTKYNTTDANLSSGGDDNLDQAFGWTDDQYSIEQLLSSLKRQDICYPVHPGAGGANHAKRERDGILAAMKGALKSASHSESAQLFWEFFEALYKERLWVSEWTGEMHYGSWNATYTEFHADYPPEVDAEYLLNRLEKTLGMVSKLSEAQFSRKFTGFTKSLGINPMKEELEQLSLKYRDDLPEWENLASILFGATNPLNQQMLEKWLVAAVARAVQPGCQADNALVLKGGQGYGKTTFFRILGGQYYLELADSTGDLESMRQLQRSWIVELAEIEGITRKKEVESLKAFLTRTKDTYRGLYEKKPADHPRHVLFGGSCNSDEIMRDATGSRRFWVIDCGDRMIDTDFLRVNRGQILATAYRKCLKGFRYWADQEMTRQSEERNQQYQESNEFQDLVDQIVTRLSRNNKAIAVKAADILTYGFGIPVQHHKQNRHDRDVADALKQSGLEKRQIGKDRYYVTLNASKARTITPAEISQVRDAIATDQSLPEPISLPQEDKTF